MLTPRARVIRILCADVYLYFTTVGVHTINRECLFSKVYNFYFRRTTKGFSKTYFVDEFLSVYQTQGLEAVASQLDSSCSIEDSVCNANSMYCPANNNAAEQEPGTVTQGNGPSDRREAIKSPLVKPPLLRPGSNAPTEILRFSPESRFLHGRSSIGQDA